MDEIVQLLNPRINRYVKVDRVNGKILKVKKTKGPFKGIQIIKRHESKERQAGKSQQEKENGEA